MHPANFPPFFNNSIGALPLWQWLGLLVIAVVSTIVGVLVGEVVLRVARRLALRTIQPWDDEIIRAVGAAFKALCCLLLGYTLALSLNLPAVPFDHFSKLVRAALILTSVWGTIRALYALAEVIATGAVKDTLDPERLAAARGRRTQVLVATRVLSVLVALVGVAITALQFEIVRSFGVSLLASAGVASVVLGFAAQRSLGALLAGIQISISQPIRMGDVVIFRGEWGQIEDIGLTYVSIRLWDERRLLVPTPRLLEEPIENWSRSRIGLTGAVFIPVHPRTSIPQLRQALKEILSTESLWDGRVCNVQLTDVTDIAATARVLVSASHPSALGDLRMAVRERMVAYLGEYQGGVFLPERRILMQNESRSTSAQNVRRGGEA